MSIVNPYAKKRPQPAAQNVAPAASSAVAARPNNVFATTATSAATLHTTAPPRRQQQAQTFSQIFGSVTAEESSSSLPQQPSSDVAVSHTQASTVLLHQQPHALYVSTRQKGNGVLNYIRNVPMCYVKMNCDFSMSSDRCALFLSCKYHDLHPEYIVGRIRQLDRATALKLLLVYVDVEDCSETLLQLNCIAVEHNMTLILAWSEEEAARYLETFKAFDGHDASIIKKREETDFVDQVANVLAGCKANKTDSQQLLGQFGNVRSMMAASMDELGLVPGIGEVKVKRLYDAFHKPFSTRNAAERRKKKLLEESKVDDNGNDEEENELTVNERENANKN